MTALQPTIKLFCGKGLGAGNILKSMRSDCVAAHSYFYYFYTRQVFLCMPAIKQITLLKDLLKTIKFCLHRILIINCSFAYRPSRKLP